MPRYLVYRLSLFELADTFYKKSVLSFTSESYLNLNSTVLIVAMENIQSINIDLNLLNPSVFNYTLEIYILSGTLNSIDGEIFKHLKKLLQIYINALSFRKLNHKQGIEWIKQWNIGLNINLTNIRQIPKEIILRGINGKPLERFPRIFPDEDFCLYVDFPFKQNVKKFI